MAILSATDALVQFLRDHGIPEDQIQAARAEGPRALELLASERMLIGEEAKYTAPECAAIAGVPEDLADRFWRALGFPDVPKDQPIFTDADARMLAAAGQLIERGISEPEVALQVTRVMGLSLARVAEAQVESFRQSIEAAMREAGADDDQIALTVLQLATALIPTLEAFLLYTWRRHLAAAARRHMVAHFGDEDPGVSLVVGFVDMVGFTSLSQQLDDRQLGRIVERFEGLAYDTVAACGGRVVKWIGDEVMFVAEDVLSAAEIALRLAEAHSEADDLPDVAVGLAAGKVLPREGDYLGPTVNLAARIVSVARRGTVVISEPTRDLLKETQTEDFVWRPLRPRVLKGIGRVQLSKLARARNLEADEEGPAPIASTRARVENALVRASDVVDQVGEPLERIEEAVKRVKERRSDRTRRRGRP
jgi:adenylate cyclase